MPFRDRYGFFRPPDVPSRGRPARLHLRPLSDLDAEAITEEATLESLGIDSLDMVELICDLEEKCDIEFGEPEGIDTVGQLVAHIDSL